MSTEVHYNPRLEWLLLLGASISICFAGFATLGVTPLLPDIARALDGEEMYALANGTALAGQLLATAIAGAWCDSRGALKPLLLGLVGFLAGLLTCGLAPTMLIFILGRMLQGLGGGLLMVSTYVLVGSVVSPLRRPFFFAAFAAAWVIPALGGPYLAGLIAANFGWRVIFYLLVPAILGAAVILLPLLRHVPRLKNPLPTRARKTVTGSAVAFLTLIIAQLGLTTPIPGGTLIATGAGIILLLSVRLILPPGTLRMAKGIPAMVASRGLINAAYIATETFIPLILVEAHHWQTKNAALVISAGSITWALGAFLQSKLATDRIRRKLPFIGGVIAAFGGVFTAASAFPALPPLLAVVGWSISAFGVGLAYPALSVLALATVRQEKHGYISSTMQLADALGGAAALTIITAAFTFLAHLPAPGPMLPAMILAVVLGIGAAAAGKRMGKLGGN